MKPLLGLYQAFCLILVSHLFNLYVKCTFSLNGSVVRKGDEFYTRKRVPIVASVLEYQARGLVEIKCNTQSFSRLAVPNTEDWVNAGIHSLSKLFKQKYDTIKSLTQEEFNYENLLKSHKEDPVEYISKCAPFRVASHNDTFQDGFCACLANLDAGRSCKVIDKIYEQAFCLDHIAEKLNSTAYCAYLKPVLQQPIKLPTRCSGTTQSGVTGSELLLFPFSKPFNMLPKSIDVETIRQEARVYYVAQKAVQRLNMFTDAHLFCSRLKSFQDLLSDVEFLPYWKPISYFYALNKYLRYRRPYALLAERDNESLSTIPFAKKNLLLVIRDARTEYEGALAAVYTLGDAVSLFTKGKVHIGYNVVAAHILTEMELIFDEYMATLNSTLQLTVVGEGGLGGGAGAILISALSQKYKKVSKSNEKIHYQLITFDTPVVGDEEFTLDLASRVQIRNIVSKNGGSIRRPCTVSVGCDETHVVKSSVKTGKIIKYVPLPGKVRLDLSEFTTVPSVWKDKAIAFNLGAQESCAVPCWLDSTCKDTLTGKCMKQYCPFI